MKNHVFNLDNFKEISYRWFWLINFNNQEDSCIFSDQTKEFEEWKKSKGIKILKRAFKTMKIW